MKNAAVEQTICSGAFASMRLRRRNSGRVRSRSPQGRNIGSTVFWAVSGELFRPRPYWPPL
jgi:hypothetical protein